jgi:hypothetical protein
MLTLTKIGNVIEAQVDSMPRYNGLFIISRRIVFFSDTNQLGVDYGDYVTKFFDLSDVVIDGSTPANQSDLDTLLTALFKLVTDGGGGGGGGDTISFVSIDGVETETTVSNGVLSGKTPLLVLREGIGYKKVVGTPGNREYSFSVDTVSFLNPFNTGGEEVYIQYK